MQIFHSIACPRESLLCQSKRWKKEDGLNKSFVTDFSSYEIFVWWLCWLFLDDFSDFSNMSWNSVGEEVGQFFERHLFGEIYQGISRRLIYLGKCSGEDIYPDTTKSHKSFLESVAGIKMWESAHEKYQNIFWKPLKIWNKGYFKKWPLSCATSVFSFQWEKWRFNFQYLVILFLFVYLLSDFKMNAIFKLEYEDNKNRSSPSQQKGIQIKVYI